MRRMTDLATEKQSLYHDTCQHRQYYMSCAEFDALWRYAGGCCQICKTPELETKRGRLCIDHLPFYGQDLVRGLLCDKCNSLMRRVDEGAITYPPSAVYTYRNNTWTSRALMAHRGWHVSARGRWTRNEKGRW